MHFSHSLHAPRKSNEGPTRAYHSKKDYGYPVDTEGRVLDVQPRSVDWYVVQVSFNV